MTIKEIRALLDLLREYGLTELEVVRGDDRVKLRREPAGPAPPSAALSPQPARGPAALSHEPVAEERASSLANLVTVEAPMVGTFYRASSPDAEPYVREGDAVKRGQVLCLIEAMKLMNEIEAKVAGRVVRILAENGQPVEYGQPLFLLEP